jgi:hypothetical protein
MIVILKQGWSWLHIFIAHLDNLSNHNLKHLILPAWHYFRPNLKVPLSLSLSLSFLFQSIQNLIDQSKKGIKNSHIIFKTDFASQISQKFAL